MAGDRSGRVNVRAWMATLGVIVAIVVVWTIIDYRNQPPPPPNQIVVPVPAPSP